jgi:hypothetical protein
VAGDRGYRTRRRGVIALLDARNESQGSQNVRPVAAPVARYTLKLAVAKAQRDHLDAAFRLDVHREAPDRTLSCRRSERA